uniref:Uncharacterized protein n=1 Tax=Meloidogyne enterolobii TaxID=390850 RepID=A0A6V7XBC2_MELEN|nr:unnamed protein product [Meloidogyne enterolobii]
MCLIVCVYFILFCVHLWLNWIFYVKIICRLYVSVMKDYLRAVIWRMKAFQNLLLNFAVIFYLHRLNYLHKIINSLPTATSPSPLPNSLLIQIEQLPSLEFFYKNYYLPVLPL